MQHKIQEMQVYFNNCFIGKEINFLGVEPIVPTSVDIECLEHKRAKYIINLLLTCNQVLV